MNKTALTYCCLLFALANACAQLPDYHVQVIPKTAGLSNPARIEDMIRDKKGFLWLLSASKVQRFDGKNFVSFSFDDRCIGIQEDDEGTIWLMSRQNIYRYQNDYIGFEKLPEYYSDSIKYRSLLAGPGKKMYILTVTDIQRWNSYTKKFEAFGISPFKTAGSFPFLKSFGNWLFYRKDEKNVVRYNVITAAQDSAKVQDANYLIPLNADSVWVRQGIGNSMLVSFNTKKTSIFKEATAHKTFTDNHFFVISGFALSPGKFFTVLDNKGYYIYTSSDKSFKKINLFHYGQPLNGKPIISAKNFYQEENGTVWFAHEEGLAHFKPHHYSIGLLSNYKYESNQEWNDDVRNFTEDSKGNIWFSTGNGFCKWDRLSGSVVSWAPDFEAAGYLNYSSVKGIGFSDGKIIVSQSEKGIWIFDPVKQTFKRPQFKSASVQNKFQKEFNQNMIKLRNGNFLALSDDAWLIEKKTFFINPLKVPEAGRSARAAYEDEQGRVWLLGRNGILALDSNFNEIYSLPDKAGGIWYNAIVQTGKETFWVACKNIYEIKLQAQKKLSVRPLFPELTHTHFSGLFKDSLHNIWMSNEEGIYRYIRSRKLCEKYDQGDNVQSFNISLSNSFRSSDGTVYFGSMNGINYFIPEEMPLQNDALQVQLLNVTINKNDSSFLLHRTMGNLGYHQNTVAFDFVSPYLYNGAKVQYRYKLEGTDTNWINLGNNSSVRFNSLQPGSYTFQVAASLNGEDWYAMQNPYSFEINPPFWKTWWFVMALFISMTSLAVLLAITRIRHIKKREAEKTAFQKLKAAGYREQLEIEQVINHFATSMNSVTRIDEILWDVAKNCISKLNFEDCVIYLNDDIRNVLIQKAAWGPKTSEEKQPTLHAGKIVNPIEIRPGNGIVGAVAVSGKAEMISDTSTDERYIVDDVKRLSEITVPIINNGKILGVIDSEHSQRNFYTERHLQILTTIASLCAGKIDTIKAEQKIREKEMELLRLNKDLATSQLTALRMQMNPHFIFNALNSVQHYILQGNVIEANKYLSKFSKLQREILHCSSQHFITLEKEIEILNSYLQLEQFRFGESFAYQINMTNEIEPVEIKIPPMMLQPFVENAIWHGLMPLQTQRNLAIYFDLHTDDILRATIRDNGVGIAASVKLKQSNGAGKYGHESKGMSMVKQRLQLLQQQYDKPFDAAITDITDVNGRVQGTQVTLKIFIGNTKS